MRVGLADVTGGVEGVDRGGEFVGEADDFLAELAARLGLFDRSQVSGVLQGSREKQRLGDLGDELRLGVDGQHVGVRVDLFAGLEFGLGQDALAFEDLDGRLGDDLREGVRGRAEVLEAALGGFLVPLLGVTVAVEDDATMLGQDVLQDDLEGGVEVALLGLDLFGELIGELVEGVGHDRVEDRERTGHREGGADGAELKLVAREGKRARTVSVASILREDRQRIDAERHVAALAGGGSSAALLHLLDDFVEHVAQVDRDDGGRGFVGAEAVVVAGRGDGSAEQTLVQVDGADDGGAEGQELRVLVRVMARLEQVADTGTADGPIDVLTGAVDAGEGLLGEEADEAMLGGDAAEQRHREHLVVVRDVGGFVDRSDFVLGRSDFVVAGLDRDPELEALALGFHHARKHAVRDGAEVLVFELLALGRLGAEEGATAGVEVGTEVEETGVDQEVLLLGTARGGDEPMLLTEERQHAGGGLVDGSHRAEQRGLLVEGFALPRHEGGRDAERGTVFGVEDVSRRGHVPSRVAAGFEGGAETAVREGGRIRLGLDEGLTRELGEGAVAVGLEEGVVLLGGEAGQRVEDVRVVRRATLEGPILDGGGHDVSGGGVELRAGLDAGLEGLENVLRQALFHLIEGEDILAVDQVDLLVTEVEAALKARLRSNRLDGVAAGWVGAHGLGDWKETVCTY